MHFISVGLRMGAIASAIIIFIAIQTPAAQASKASDNLVARGLVQLKGGQVVAATKYFNGAVQLDPKDPRALFYLGVALNRMGQHGAALESFQRMWNLKVSHAELGLEGGWAAIAQGRISLAITLLEPYVKANPDNAKAREFLGRAYLGDGRLDAAEAELKRAIELDPAVKPTSLYYLGNIAALRNDGAGVSSALTSLLQDAPDSRTGNVLRNTLREAAATAPRKQRKPWFASASLSFGNNSNVIGLPVGSVLPTDVSSKDSNFIRSQFDTGYSFGLTPNSSITLGYGLTHERYTDVSQFDSMSHNVYGDYRLRVDDEFSGGLRLSHSLSQTEGDTSVQRSGISPSATWRWGESDATTLRYTVSPTNYTSDPSSAVLNRDGTNHVFSLSHSTRIDNEILPLGVNAQFGVSRIVNNADGDDYDYNSHGWFVSVSRGFDYDIRASMSFSYQIDDYRNRNSLAGAGFQFNRGDNISRLNFYLERPLSFFDVENLSVFLNWQYLDNRSNISFFDYSQTSINLGVTARF